MNTGICHNNTRRVSWRIEQRHVVTKSHPIRSSVLPLAPVCKPDIILPILALTASFSALMMISSSKFWTLCSRLCWPPPEEWRPGNANSWMNSALKVLGPWDGVEDAFLPHLLYKSDVCSSSPTFELMQVCDGYIQWHDTSEIFNRAPLLMFELSLLLPPRAWEADNLFGSVGKPWRTSSCSLSCNSSLWSLVVENCWVYFFKLSAF